MNEPENLKSDYNISNEKLDLSLLHELADGDLDFEKEYLETFLSQSESDLDSLKFSKKAFDFESSKKMIHKMKSSVLLFNDSEKFSILKKIEEEISEENQMQFEIQQVINYFEFISQEIRVYLSNQ